MNQSMTRRSPARGVTPDDGASVRSLLLGESPAMSSLLDTIDRMAGTDVDVLLLGETGTGKELLAQALHRTSGRSRGPFVAVDCGAIPAALLETELFGHERGAFTGASERRTGLVPAAHEGTFFLDEVGELPLALQGKLLRVLQERRVRRVGSAREDAVDVRVIAATSRDLEQAVKAGQFRQDLFFRLNVVQVTLPPLRARQGDVRLLAEAMLARIAGELGRPAARFTPAALQALEAHAWPGNVRELQNVVRAAVAMCRGDAVDVRDLPERLRHAPPAPPPDDGYFAMRARRLAEFEREYLVGALTRAEGDVRAAATSARMPRGSFYRLLKRHGLRPDDYRRVAGEHPAAGGDAGRST